jgi:hypothetical protein
LKRTSIGAAVCDGTGLDDRTSKEQALRPIMTTLLRIAKTGIDAVERS